MYNSNDSLGRNDPCACGSGKKYKKCCLSADEQDRETLHSPMPWDLVDSDWKKLRNLEGEIINNDLLSFIENELPENTLETAFQDFLLESDLPDSFLNALQESIFIYWALFDWIPAEYSDNDLCDGFLKSEQTIAQLYLEKYEHSVNNAKRKFFKAMENSYYSFYIVEESKSGISLTLNDIFLGTEHVVKESKASTILEKGDIIFCRIITLNNISIVVGFMPTVLDANDHLKLLDCKELFKDNLTLERLKTLKAELKMICLAFVMEKHNQKTILRNTDGDDLEFHIHTYELKIKPREVFEKLIPLIFDRDPEPFLETAKKTKSGELKEITFHWSKKGNKLHESWDNTTLGHLKIKGTKLTVEVNSRKRSDKIKKLLIKYLADNAVLIKSTKKTPEQAMKSKGSLPKRIETEEENAATKETLQEIMQMHWVSWVDSKIPVLNDMTPREARKTESGRQKLAALLVGFEQHNKKLKDLATLIPIDYLRQELEM